MIKWKDKNGNAGFESIWKTLKTKTTNKNTLISVSWWSLQNVSVSADERGRSIIGVEHQPPYVLSHLTLASKPLKKTNVCIRIFNNCCQGSSDMISETNILERYGCRASVCLVQKTFISAFKINYFPIIYVVYPLYIDSDDHWWVYV